MANCIKRFFKSKKDSCKLVSININKCSGYYIKNGMSCGDTFLKSILLRVAHHVYLRSK